MEGDGPVWRNGYAPLMDLLSRCGDFQLIPLPWRSSGAANKVLNSVQSRVQEPRVAPELARQVKFGNSDQHLLFTVAFSPKDVRLAASTYDLVANGDAKRVIYISENIEPADIAAHYWKSFDLILSFCPDLGKLIEEETGVPVLYWAAHLDCLNFHNAATYRPIDVLCYGRTRTDILFEIQERFARPDSGRLCVDFTTRWHPNRLQSAAAEFRLLFDLLSKSRLNFCFAAHDVPRFKGRSPLLYRWVHGWAAGCTILGTNPNSDLVKEHINWENSTIELPAEVDAACAKIEEVLMDVEGMQRQGLLNTSETVARHDSRYRLRNMFAKLGFDEPAFLGDEIEQLAALNAQLTGKLKNL